MYNFCPYFTNDGSVGLFSPDADDVYHSTYGALTEAYEKFIIPADFENFFKNNFQIKILDLCFGIGYNTKSFLNFFLNFLSKEKSNLLNKKQKIFLDKNTYNSTIYSDNIKYNDKIFTDNKRYKIFIRAVDKDKILMNLSSFIVTGKNNLKNNKLSFNQEKINRILSNQTKEKFKLRKEVNLILFQKMAEKAEKEGEALIDKEAEQILYSDRYKKYFDNRMKRFLRHYKNVNGITDPLLRLNVFLHNIYYLHISKRHKNACKYLKLFDFDFSFENSDARWVVKNDNNLYNFIFLDAFTPSKCPCLWTVDFFKLLFNHLDYNGMILTYSNSAAVRNAFIQAGFYVGKNFLDGKSNGTIAVKNKSLIKNGLSEFDLGLLKSKAGIFYRDKNLNASNEDIIAAHNAEAENSELMSSSQYIKKFR